MYMKVFTVEMINEIRNLTETKELEDQCFSFLSILLRIVVPNTMLRTIIP